MNKRRQRLLIPLLLWLTALPLGCWVDGHGDQNVDTERECIVFEGLCGGCDPACRMIRDTPIRDDDVVTDGADRNGEDVVYDPDAEGIVLGGVHGTGPDTDGDGLPDSSDPNPEDPHGDVDGDGVPDAYEIYLGRDPEVADPLPPDDHWYFVLSEDGGPVWRDIPPDIPLTVRSADIYFLMDVTGSMGGEISNLRDTISSYIIPEIDDVIEDANFGVGRFGDFRYRSYHTYDDPFTHLLDITDDVSAVQSMVNSLSLGYGYDGPESQTTALWQIATGNGLTCSEGPASCPAGTTGYPCFRADAQPIVILFTDAGFHRGVMESVGPYSISNYDYENYYNYDCIPHPSDVPTLVEAVAALNDIGAKVITVYSGYMYGQTGHTSTWSSYYRDNYPNNLGWALDSWYLGLETESVDSDGYPFLYAIPSNGTGLGSEVVNAVNDLVDTMLLQVNSRWSDTDPAVPDGSVLIQDVDPVWCSHCDSLDHVNNYANDVYPGSSVTFQVHLENDAIPPGPSPQEFVLRVRILNNDTAVLAERTIHVLVPGEHGFNEPIETGRYWKTWDARTTCGGADETPDWDQLYFDATTPPGTSITFILRTANTWDGLSLATPVTAAFVPGDESPIALQDVFDRAGIDNGQRYLRLEAVLDTDDPDVTPILHETTTVFYCLSPEG